MGDPRSSRRRQGHPHPRPQRRELIDGFAGLYCVNIGYGRDEVAEAIPAQAKRLAYYHTYVGPLDRGAIRSPTGWSDGAGHDDKVFYGLSGSDANETQVKLVWYYNNVLGRPEKKKIISRERGYHGSSVMSGWADRPLLLPRRHSTCRTGRSCTPAPRTTTGVPRPARARRSSPRGGPTSSRS